MTRDDDVRDLLDDIEESYWAMGYVGLYEFGWGLRGLKRDHSPAEAEEISRQAYDVFRSRHQLMRMWSRWPIALDTAWLVEDGTPLDFDLDHTQDVSIPIQVLVPAEE